MRSRYGYRMTICKINPRINTILPMTIWPTLSHSFTNPIPYKAVLYRAKRLFALFSYPFPTQFKLTDKNFRSKIDPRELHTSCLLTQHPVRRTYVAAFAALSPQIRGKMINIFDLIDYLYHRFYQCCEICNKRGFAIAEFAEFAADCALQL